MNNPKTLQLDLRELVPVLLPLMVTLAVFYPVLDSPFKMDELMQLFTLANFGVVELLLTPHGGHLYYFLNIFYSALHALFGIDSQPYYGLLLFTHLVNVLLFYGVALLFSRNTLLAIVTATVWGCMPVAEGVLGWFAAYGQVLLSFCLLWIFFDIARIWDDPRPISRCMQIRWYVLLLAAAGSFGFGLGIAALFWVVLLLFLYQKPNIRPVVLRFLTLLPLVLLLYLAVHASQILFSNRPPLHGVEMAMDREPGVYILRGITSLWHMMSYGLASIFIGGLVFSDPAGIRAGPLQGSSIHQAILISSFVMVLWLVLNAFYLRKKSPQERMGVFALVGLAVVCYGVFAAWGTLSGRFAVVTEIPWEWQSITPRYHYNPPMFLLLAFAILTRTTESAEPVSPGRITRTLVLGVWAFTTIYFGATSVRNVPANPNQLESEVQQMLTQIQRAQPGEHVYLLNRKLKGHAFFPKSTLYPGSSATFVIAFPKNTVEGRIVNFVESDPELYAQLSAFEGTRIAELVVNKPHAAVSLPFAKP